MIPPTLPNRSAEIGGALSSAAYGISEDPEDLAALLILLRDKIYSNKVLAVLREYATNAWDAHVDAGLPYLPIKVVLPTPLDPNLTIRDYGKGLTRDEVEHVYILYGKSLKRSDSKQAGTFGVGAKAAHAYTDQYTITSFNNGVKRVYVAVLDETHIGQCHLLSEESTDESGMEIRVPVRAGDIERFREEARWLFAAFQPPPELKNLVLEFVSYPVLKSPGCLLPIKHPFAERGWVAVMGCVPYKLDLAACELPADLSHLRNVKGGVLVFEMGEVDFAVSRETLDYTPRTKAAVAKAIRAVTDLEMQALKAQFTLGGGWERRQKWAQIMKSSRKDLATALALFSEKVNLAAEMSPQTFTLLRYQSQWTRRGNKKEEWLPRVDAGNVPVYRIDPLSKSGMVIAPTDRGLTRYSFLSNYYVAVAREGKTLAEVRAELEVVLKSVELDGYPIRDLSEFKVDRSKEEETKKEEKFREDRRKKYAGKLFKHRGDFSKYPFSDQWEPVDALPPPNAIVVTLVRFLPDGDKGAYDRISVTLRHLRDLGVVRQDSMPELWGFRTTTKQKRPADLGGHGWDEWEKKVFRKAAKQYQGHMQRLELAETVNEFALSRRRVAALRSALGRNHPLSVYFTTLWCDYSDVSVISKPNGRKFDHHDYRVLSPFRKDTEAYPRLDLSRYPLLPTGFLLRSALAWQETQGSGREPKNQWVDYILAMDKAAECERRTQDEMITRAIEKHHRRHGAKS